VQNAPAHFKRKPGDKHLHRKGKDCNRAVIHFVIR
jgi:hypothetical protein